MDSRGRAAWAGAIAGRTLILAICWWAITEGDPKATGVGGLAVASAVLLSLRAHAPQPFHALALLRFLPVFLWRSLAGGLDVARRALVPDMRLQPVLVEYRTELPEGLPRVFLANVISLLPGTLSADIRGDRLCLHVLSASKATADDLRRLELAVAPIFR
jgi:multicomponent Na+:H+ antiporter subunit E